MLIALYGINNIGKSTQVARLVERLRAQGRAATARKYPVYEMEPSGAFLNRVLRGGEQKLSEAELQLWFTVNRYQAQAELEALLRNQIVVAEDYTGTGLAWGVAKGLDLPWLETVNEGLIREDFAILLDGERHLAAREPGHVHEANDALVERCRQVHLELAARHGWTLVSAEGSVEDVHERIWQAVLPRL